MVVTNSLFGGLTKSAIVSTNKLSDMATLLSFCGEFNKTSSPMLKMSVVHIAILNQLRQYTGDLFVFFENVLNLTLLSTEISSKVLVWMKLWSNRWSIV